MRSGAVAPSRGAVSGNAGVLWIMGINGHFWSSRSYDNSDAAYGMTFNASSVIPSYGSIYIYRYYGFPLRCLSTVLDYVEMLFSKIILL